MAKIKICGLSTLQDIQAANNYQPDYIGFVFAPKSRRYITPCQAENLKQQLSSEISAVGVFVNEPKEAIASLCTKKIIDIIQLHGTETESDIQWLKQHTGKPIIKAVSIKCDADILRWAGSAADYMLFDNGTGGTGRTFDWNLIHKCRCTKPYFLAGGIHSGNLAAALSTDAYALDLSSGVETDGKKDPAKIEEAIRIVRTKTGAHPFTNQ